MKDRIKKIRYNLANVFTKHQSFVIICAFLIVASLVIYRLYVLGTVNPDQNYIDDQKILIQSIQFDQDAIDQIQQLRDSNVKTPGTDLQKNRQNPFSE